MADAGRRGLVPGLLRNPTSIVGAWLTTLSVLAFVAFIALEQFRLLHSPYAGLFGFIVVPAFFLLGLALIPIGVWVEARRRRTGHAAWRWPAIDLGNARTRVILAGVAGLTLVNLAIIGVAGFGAAHYSESNRFCGQVCHEPMEPQFTAFQTSAHSRINCVDCHVAPDVPGFLTAKINGTRQVYKLLTGTYDRPIPSPRDRIPVPAVSCEGCHAPISPDLEVKRMFRERKDNETSSEIVTTLVMYSGKSHWHARPDVVVEYVATDNTLAKIPYVRVIAGGNTTEYFAEDVTAPPAGQPVRRMDCLDCHSRPAHTLASTPAQVVDRAIARGEINTTVPFVRSEMVEALAEEHPAGTDASQAIVQRLTKVFGTATPEAVQAVQVANRLYRENVFPKMKITWGTYTDQLFHINDTGCFRCHDDTHTVKGDPEKKIRQDCELCHLEP